MEKVHGKDLGNFRKMCVHRGVYLVFLNEGSIMEQFPFYSPTNLVSTV